MFQSAISKPSDRWSWIGRLVTGLAVAAILAALVIGVFTGDVKLTWWWVPIIGVRALVAMLRNRY